MLRFFRYLALLLAIVLYAGGCSRDALQYFYRTGVAADDYRYGDLYRLANLPQFKEEATTCPSVLPVVTPAGQTTSLYIIGDSFTEPERLSARDFPVVAYRRIKWENPGRVQLDTTNRNILLIETVERHFRDHFSQPVTALTVVADTSQKPAPPNLTVGERVRNFVGLLQPAAAVEERLETLLFGHGWALWWKERKAGFNLAVFKPGKSQSGSVPR